LASAVLSLLITAQAAAFQPQQNPNGVLWKSSASETWSGSSQSNTLGQRAQLAGVHDSAPDTMNPGGIAGYLGILDPVSVSETPLPTLTETPVGTVTPTLSPTLPAPTPTSTGSPSASPTASATVLLPTNTATPSETMPVWTPTASSTHTPTVPTPSATPSGSQTPTPTGSVGIPTSTPSCSVTEEDYDLNGDGRVNGEDLFLLIQAMKQGTDVPDFNCDGMTDARDLFLMVKRWETEIPAP
jgi:hypothetical protein